MKAYSDKTLTIHQGDVLTCLADIPDGSVHCVVTSPPYWGLRDYGTAKWEGGDPGCDHSFFKGGHGDASTKQVTSSGTQKYQYTDLCKKCGAVRVDRQLGLEKLHDCLAWARGAELCGECHVCRMVAVMREVYRVLRPDGTLWLNYGDSYAGSWGNYAPTGQGGQRDKNTERWERGGYNGQEDMRPPMTGKLPGLKPKGLVGMPWRVALALQADGWYLRSDIVWHKPNPMPESVTDRPTKSHEYIFLLTKNARYFYDAEAVKEIALYPNDDRGARTDSRRGTECNSVSGKTGTHRNARTVWTMATQAFKESHFATFPEELPRKCIMAGTSEKGVCPDCGAPWVRVVERTTGQSKECPKTQSAHEARGGHGKPSGTVGKAGSSRIEPISTTLGWRPSCSCGNANTVPATVLDPFGGSGTTGKVANELGRAAVLVELNPEYIAMLLRRNRQPSLL